ncbi:MAG: glycosyl transferase [Saprospiraceae bacterium]|nr:glycosyl transferase [Saprospiraceae bacterium]
MKILYAIQGTGNGHISRARDIVPILARYGELDLLVSGIQADVELGFPIKYQYKGLSLIFGKKGGVDVVETYRKSNMLRLIREVRSLPILDYDLVISDFEPVSAWACFLKRKTCIGLSHQAAVLHEAAPRPAKFDPIGKAVLKRYAPVTHSYGFHFQAYAEGIFTPIIRQQVRDLKVGDEGHYTVYLPAYADLFILKTLAKFKLVRWQVFSKHTKRAYQTENIFVQPIQNEAFLHSLATCRGVLCGAGFETPAEALFLEKKLMVVPMKGQYEQQCNAAALRAMGVPVIKSLKEKHHVRIGEWLANDTVAKVDYPDSTAAVLRMVVGRYGQSGNV